MFMSKLAIDPVQMTRAGIYEAHQALWRAFSDSADRRRDFLYRQIDQRTFLTVSRREPPPSGMFLRRDVKPYAPQLRDGERIHFSLRFNPVVKRRDEGGRQLRINLVQDWRRKLLEEGTPESKMPSWHAIAETAAAHWLDSRKETLGIAAQTILVETYTLEQFEKANSRAPITLARIDMTGFATVTDAASLGEALIRGVGCAKGFGFGLLLVRRA